jgi:hypothetical protein
MPREPGRVKLTIPAAEKVKFFGDKIVDHICKIIEENQLCYIVFLYFRSKAIRCFT